ncbi:hypothetical protein [Hydrogenoanaerobacterium sp.]|uniref:hypothetical protein n=1 Tax=Hydrogenoanaerobacterium sp. TaxID=2953763 RepID=UPI00289887B2|nr:hypothetical protein [Hydrogenoanaerobacterium sp.]
MNTTPSIRRLCALFALLFLVLSFFSFMGHSNNGDGVYEELFRECEAEPPQSEQLTVPIASVPVRVPAYVESQPQVQRSVSTRPYRAVSILVVSLLCGKILLSIYHTETSLSEAAPACGRELLIRFEHRSDGKK